MEINITHLLNTDMYEFAHSIAESGNERAGRDTWNAALKGPRPLLKTEEEREAFHEFIDETGAWSAEDRAHWTDNDEDALFLQFIAGDVRQCPAILEEIEFEERWPGMWYFQTPADKENALEDGPHESRDDAYRAASNELVGFNQTRRAESLDEIDWQEYEKQAEEGRISGRLYRSDEDQIFYSLSN